MSSSALAPCGRCGGRRRARGAPHRIALSPTPRHAAGMPPHRSRRCRRKGSTWPSSSPAGASSSSASTPRRWWGSTDSRRSVAELGFKAIFLAPGCVNRRPWHDAYYDPLWAECERLDVPVTFHGGGQTHLKPDFSLEIFDKLMMWHTFNQPLGMMTVAVSLTAGGVFDRLPARRLEVSALDRGLPEAPALRGRAAEDPLGQLAAALPHPAATGVSPPLRASSPAPRPEASPARRRRAAPRSSPPPSP